MFRTRTVRPSDAAAWTRLRQDLWPDAAAGEHADEIERFFRGDFPREPWAVFLAENEANSALGFAEASIRPHAEGCVTNRVAYLEGWFVVASARRQGIGRALLRAVEAWAREQGCTELASDAAADNDISHDAHVAGGFADVGLIRCFAKRI